MRLTIVLDLDDTLYLERDYAASGIAAVAQHAQANFGITGFGEVAWALWQAGERHRLFDATLTRLGRAATPSLVADLVRHYRAHSPTISLAPDAESFLRNPPPCSLALITDGFLIAQRQKIAALGLDRFPIDPVICTDQWGRDYWKPHPRAFEAVRASHAFAERFVYVADNPAKDFVAPQALGWATVQIDRSEAVHSRRPPPGHTPADLTIRSLAELTPIRLDRLQTSNREVSRSCG